MTLTFTFDAEQLGAISKRCGSLTAQDFLTQMVSDEVARFVREDFDAAVVELATAARQLPYEQRMALIAQVQSQIA